MVRGKVFVISAPSGGGKTTLLRRLMQELAGLAFSVSHTTRRPRTGEKDGVDYHFVSRSQFEDMVANNDFLEWAEVYGQLYGTAVEEVESVRAQGVDVLLDIDVQGAHSVKKLVPEAVFVLVLPPSWQVLRERLERRRSDDAKTIDIRLRNAREQVQSFEIYSYAVVNHQVDAAVHALKCVVEAERSSIEYAAELIQELLRQPPEV